MTPPVLRPTIARADRRASVVPAALALAALGGAVFLGLTHARAARAQRDVDLPQLRLVAYAEPPPVLAPAAPAAPPAPLPPALMRPPVYVPPPHRFVEDTSAATAAAQQREARLHAPSLVVDLAPQRSATLIAAAEPPPPSVGAATPTVAALPTGPQAAPERLLQSAETETPQVAVATRMANLDTTVPQGAVIAATLETALDSDLPGYARAVVSRDVLGFDGTQTLIPAGSHLIGRYASGVAQGSARIFIVWTRLIRPDGVSVDLASPATDDLGEAGVTGRVNRHFLQRFGGSILLSVLSGGISAGAAAVSGGQTVIVGTAGQAGQLAQQAAGDMNIPPTIRTPQGARVRVFVARDLDFSGVGPAPR